MSVVQSNRIDRSFCLHEARGLTALDDETRCWLNKESQHQIRTKQQQGSKRVTVCF